MGQLLQSKTTFFLKLILISISLIFSGTLFGQATKTWNKTTGGAWTTAANWTPSGAPAAGDNVIINSDQSAAITAHPAISLASLTISGNCNLQSSATIGSSDLITITGTLSVSAGKTLTLGISNTGRTDFTLSSTATGNIAGTVYMNSYSGSGFDRTFTNSGDLTITSTGLITGENTAIFLLNAGATLEIGSTAGITTTGATGNIQVPGTRTYSTGANYVYNGSSAQVTGDGLSQNTPANLTINTATSAVTVTSSTAAFSISGNLTVTNGNLIIQATNADYAIAGDLSVAANGTFTHNVNWATAGKLLKVSGNVAVDGIFTYPVRSHLQMNGVNKTIRSGSNASSSFSIVTLTNSSGTINASGNIKVNDNLWAGFGTTGGTFATNGQTVTLMAGLFGSGGTVNINGGTLNVTGGFNAGTTSGNSTVNFSSGTINTDALTLGDGTRTGTFNHTGGTANITGNVTINPSCSYVCTNSPTINVSGNWINNGTYTKATETVTFNGTSAISGSSANSFYNLTISGSLTAASATALNIAGTWNNNGTFTHNNGTVTLNGTSQQTMGGTSSTVFNNLTISNVSGAILGTNQTVNNTLSLTGGNLDLSSKVLTMGATAPAISGTFSATRMIIADGGGEIRKSATTNATASYTFPIGDNTGTAEYTPITLTVTGSAYSSAYVGLSVNDAKHSNNASATNYLTRYWNVNQSGITGCTATVSATFINSASDVAGTIGSIKAAQLNGTFNQATNPWIKFGSALTTSPMSITGATITSGQTSVFTGVTSADPTVSITGGGVTVCSGTNVSLGTTVSADPTVTYSWSPATFLSSTTIANPVVTAPTATTSYTVTVRDGNGISVASAASTITVNPSPTITGTLSVCIGSTTALTGSATANATSPWVSATPAVATVSNTGVVTGVSAGTSVITYKNTNGCTTTATVTVNSLPTVTLTSSDADNMLCAGTSVTFTAGGGNNYNFRVAGSSVQNSATATYTTSSLTNGQTVDVIVTNASGCNTTSTAITNIINSTPVINLSKTDETCPSSNNGSITTGLTGGLSSVRYIKLTQKYVNADAWQQVAEIEAYESFTGTNVARSSNGATATSSSTYPGYPPSLAIDGNNSGNSNFWHSNSANINEWIKVDLATGKKIDYIKIYNRLDCCSQRGQNMLLELFDASNNLVYSRTVDLWQSGANIPVNVNVLDLFWADGATTLDRTGLHSGTYTFNYADVLACNSTSNVITVNTTNTAPAITVQPTAPATTCSGIGTQTMSVTATGTGLTYSWRKNGVAVVNGSVISGQGTATLTLTNPLAADTGSYDVVVSGTCTPAVTSSAVVAATVNTTSPTINLSKTDTCPSSNNGGITTGLTGGLTNIRYIKLTQKYAAPQHVAEFEIYEAFTGTNLAMAPTRAAGTSNNGTSYLAGKSIDGNTSTYWQSNTSDTAPSIQVDLKADKNIDYIKIYNRTDAYSERGQNMLLELFDVSNNLLYSKTIDLWQSGANVPVTVNVLDLSWADGATTLNRTGLPAGTYTFNYADVLGCSNTSSAATISVTPNNTAGTASASPALCVNTVLTNITHTTTGATGIGTATGLPTGVTVAWSANTITISGTPTASGTFNYSIPLTGGCGSVYATGTITVTPNNTAGTASSSPTLCVNTVLTNITHTTTGATGISNNNVAGANGLPAGVKAIWSSNTITISGTPTASGTFNYSIPLTGGCGSVNATGIITVNTSPSTPGTIAQPATICVNSTGNLFSIPSVAGATSYTWSVTGTGWAVTAGGTTTSATITAGPGSGTVSVTATNTCGTSSAVSTGTITPTAPVIPIEDSKIQPTCAVSTGSVTLSNLPSNGNWTINPGNHTGTGSPATISGLTSGTYNFKVTDSYGCTSPASANIVINPAPVVPGAPTVGTITQPTASVNTGSVVLNGLPTGGTINPGAITYTGTSVTISNLVPGTYNYTVTNTLGCTSAASANIVITAYVPNVKTWISTASTDWFVDSNWSPSGVPTAIHDISIPLNTSKAIISGSTAIAYANTLTIENGGKLQLNGISTLMVTDKITVKTGGTFDLLSGATLLQVNNTANDGIVNVYRNSAKIILNDYTYWSAPTWGTQKLLDFSLKTLPKYFLAYSNGWTYLNAATTTFSPGTGYAILAPNDTDSSVPTSKTFQFIGTPNNGDVSVPVVKSSTLSFSSKLVGNPYPSAIDADKFIDANIYNAQTGTGTISGTLYFWTHNNAYANGTYTSNDYATYTKMGGTSSSPDNLGHANTLAPQQFIASCQGFVVQTVKTGNVLFTNAMRTAGGTIVSSTDANGTPYNGNFYKNANAVASNKTLEKNRIWVNFTNNSNLNFSQILVGYVETATNNYDPGFDGTYNSSGKTGMYSLIGSSRYAIQAKALPFSNNDVIPLGYTTDIKGNATISIDSVDGLFTNGQDIFVEDKLLNVIHKLNGSPYTFSSEAGTFNSRFVLRYTAANALGLNDFEDVSNEVLVSSQNQTIKVKSETESINKVFVYDALGREIYQNIKVGANETSISDLRDQQILIVKVVLVNGQSVSKKVIY